MRDTGAAPGSAHPSGLHPSVQAEQPAAVPSARRGFSLPIWAKALFALLLLAAVATLWVLDGWLSQTLTSETRTRAELRLVLYAGNIEAELLRTQVVPSLLARDPMLRETLQSESFGPTSEFLIGLQVELGSGPIELLSAEGQVVGATDRARLGASRADDPVFLEALAAQETVFVTHERETGAYGFFFARAIREGGETLGVVTVEVDLTKFERAWAGFSDVVALLDGEGRIILSTEPRWRGRTEAEALAILDPPSAIARAMRAAQRWAERAPEEILADAGVLRSETALGHRDWRLVSFTRLDGVRSRVNGMLAVVALGFAGLLSLGLMLFTRAALRRSAAVERESAELRALNTRLQREIAARIKAQGELKVAAQSLEQSSKLAVLGEMAAAVGHELNQPLAAMKTYLAGARLLMIRRRSEEALVSLQRIDDLIDRMTAIARQLKSFARKGGEAFAPVDLRRCVEGALALMEPRLRERRVLVVQTLPRSPVMVLGDALRLEQVIVNLLSNAIDATRTVSDPQIDLILTAGDTATLTIKDNGTGIRDLERIFEPFHTSKPAGEGAGLGLAISSGIVADHGGQITARNLPEGGAAFDVTLPLLERKELSHPASAVVG